MRYLKKFEGSKNEEIDFFALIMSLFTENGVLDVNEECQLIIRWSGGNSDVMTELLYIYIPRNIYNKPWYITEYKIHVVLLDNKGYEVNKTYSDLDDSSRRQIISILDKKLHNYDIQKKVLDEHTDKYNSMKEFGFAPGIEEEFKFLENGMDMGLL